MSRALLVIACAALAAAEQPMNLVQARLARGDAQGARAALVDVPRPADDRPAELAAWLDASARVAWARGEMDEAFALSLEALAVAEDRKSTRLNSSHRT